MQHFLEELREHLAFGGLVFQAAPDLGKCWQHKHSSPSASRVLVGSGEPCPFLCAGAERS